MTDWDSIYNRISKVANRSYRPASPSAVAGGDINRTYVIRDQDMPFFVKLNRADRLSMFEAEKDGLKELAQTRSIRVPRPVCCDIAGDESYIVMEYLPVGQGPGHSAETAGRQLAALHRNSADNFGWYRDNTIGSTPQINRWDKDWLSFWRERRLGYQLELACRNGYGSVLENKGRRLQDSFGVLFEGYAPAPSLLHGDLWGGNFSFLEDDTPVIFDPAVYYGDREADIAMTELFGGFSREFYAGYQSAWPLDTGYQKRKPLYNLYHILNHLNMFGDGYLGQSLNLIERLQAQIDQ